jgi:hypothetical protein
MNMPYWSLSDLSAQKKLERAFRNRSIDFSHPGFCDDEPFLAAERLDARFLETYARYVEVRKYDDSYLTSARKKIEVVAEAVRSAVASDGRSGACVDASGMVARMLDRLAIWNYVAKVTLTITFGSSGFEPEYFWVLDEGNFVASHAIVVAPPFGVIDVTIKQQPYPPDKRTLLPEILLADQLEPSTWAPEDLANSLLLSALRVAGIRFEEYLNSAYPQMLDVMSALPARLVRLGGVALKYIPVAVGGFVEQLEELTGYKPCGRTATDIFQTDVLPKLPR